MGQKIHPKSFRLGINLNWTSRWFPSKTKNFGKFLEEDEAVRKIIQSKIGQAGIAGIEIERTGGNIKILIKAAKPGLIIGRGGKGIEDLNKEIISAIRKVRNTKTVPSVNVNVEELKRTEISAQYTAQQIAWDIEKRMPFRRTIKKYLESLIQNKEVRGAKIMMSGRLDGSEIARTEWLSKGALPLQTLRSNIDFGQATAFCTYGTIGIKVWIYKGEVFRDTKTKEQNQKQKK